MTQTNLSTLIDDYADLKAIIGKLEQQKKDLEKNFADLAPGAYESEKYRLSISDSTRESPDEELKAGINKAVEEYRATLTRQYLTAHTNETAVRTHRIGLRNGKKVAA